MDDNLKFIGMTILSALFIILISVSFTKRKIILPFAVSILSFIMIIIGFAMREKMGMGLGIACLSLFISSIVATLSIVLFGFIKNRNKPVK